jgi:hypothetical protein
VGAAAVRAFCKSNQKVAIWRGPSHNVDQQPIGCSIEGLAIITTRSAPRERQP